jgi:hypothetical protein
MLKRIGLYLLAGIDSYVIEKSGSGSFCRRSQYVNLHAIRFDWLGGGGPAL